MIGQNPVRPHASSALRTWYDGTVYYFFVGTLFYWLV